MLHLVHTEHEVSPRREALLQTISQRVQALSGDAMDTNGQAPASHFGIVSCVAELRLRLVPFYEPCVIFVLSGTKNLGDDEVGEGGCLAVPAPSNFHMANVPNPRKGLYRALVFPFSPADTDHVRAALSGDGAPSSSARAGEDIVTYGFDEDTLQAFDHYLQSSEGDSPARIQHRKREILLILAERDPRLLSLASGVENWSHRLRTVMAQDSAHAWSMEEVCRHLGITESTLRRHLRKEDTSFREVLSEFRLGNALMSVLMSAAPIYQIAYDNGFQSVSRFSENFRKRFGATPTEVRGRLPETG